MKETKLFFKEPEGERKEMKLSFEGSEGERKEKLINRQERSKRRHSEHSHRQTALEVRILCLFQFSPFHLLDFRIHSTTFPDFSPHFLHIAELEEHFEKRYGEIMIHCRHHLHHFPLESSLEIHSSSPLQSTPFSSQSYIL
jgi:hypothetical protein